MKATVSKVNSRLTVKERKQEGILSYDIDNNYPNRIRDIVANSGMGKSCVNLYRKFIFGKGFQDIEFAKKVINSCGLTPDKLLAKIAKDMSDIGGFAVHVNFNALYEISEVNFQPIAQVRFTTDDSDHPDMFAIYDDWGARQIKKDKILFIDKFDPSPEAIQEQVDKVGGWELYKGQVWFFSNEGDAYPLAIYDAELEDMQTDAQAKTYKYRNVTTSFMASHMLVVSKIESDDKEEGGNEKSQLISDLEEYQGADNAQKLMVIEKETEEQTFQLQKIDQQSGDKLYEWTETSVRNNIRQSFLIPPVLLMELEGRIGGTSDEMIDATKSYNSTTEDERLCIEECMRVVFGLFHDKTVNTSGNFSILPREAITKDDAQNKKDIASVIINNGYTTEQKIKILVLMYGIAEEDAESLVKPSDSITSTQTLAEKLQVEGTQSLVGILTNPDLKPEEKRGTLKVLFGLEDEQINKIIPADVNQLDPNTAV